MNTLRAMEMRAAYWRVRQAPEEGTAAAAIKVHSQACGLVAFVFGVHPDAVAQAVRLEQPWTKR